MTKGENDMTTEAEREELITFLVGHRKAEEHMYWFIGKYSSLAEENPLICNSVRGDISEDGQVWKPLPAEECECCKAVDTAKDVFALFEHCQTEEHIRNLVAKLTPDNLDREYKYMIETVYESLVKDWSK